VGRSTGAPPGPDGAPYAVNLRAATPISWQYLHLRVLTVGGLTTPPAVVDGAPRLSGRSTSYFDLKKSGRGGP
jgi:hypothetical protein